MAKIQIDVPNLFPLSAKNILVDVLTERRAQNMVHGQQDYSPERWISILGEEYGEVCREVCDCTFKGKSWKANYRAELIQLAAVAVQMVESYDRQFPGLSEAVQ